jgi:shikimate dehydrogenase
MHHERLFGLIGFPLSHSFSKKYFTDKFERESITDCRYELFPIEAIQLLPQIISANPSIRGLNVTIPYKESVIPYLHGISKEVSEIGACNCIDICEGRLTGHNTDVIGFEKMLLPFLRPHHQQALILGTGGAAKAVAWVLNKLHITCQYVSRKAGIDQLSYENLNESILDTHHLIVNTTPLGMWPNLEETPSVPFTFISDKHLCVDLIYNPEKTKFLYESERRGAAIVNGMDMLIIQAEESWQIWNR